MQSRRAIRRPSHPIRTCTLGEPLEDRRLLTDPGSAFPNVIVGSAPTVQNEPSLAVNPDDPQHVVLAWVTELSSRPGARGIAVSVTRDGGQQWTQAEVPMPSGYEDQADLPVVRFAKDGRLFLAWQATGLNGKDVEIVPVRSNNKLSVTDEHFETNSGIFVARSDDGGLHWGAATQVAGHVFHGAQVPFDAQPDLAIDHFETKADGSPNPNFGNVYVTWTRFFPTGMFPGRPDFTGGGSAQISVSRDGGQSWQTSTRTAFIPLDANANGVLEPNEFHRAEVSALVEDLALLADADEASTFSWSPRLSVGPNGDVYVGASGGGTFTFFHSADGGQSFLQPNRGTEERVIFGAGFFARAGLARLPFEPNPGMVRAVFADPTRPGVVYAAEALAISGAASSVFDMGDIFVARSEDHGRSWTFNYGDNSERRIENRPVNDENGELSAKATDPNPILAIQGLPALAIDQSGTLAAIWHDSRRGVRNEVLDVFGAIGTSDGLTFSPNFRISDESSPLASPAGTSLAGDLGQRMSFEARHGQGYAAWTDFRNGQADIAFAKFSLSPLPTAFNDRFEPNNSSAAAVSLGDSIEVELPRLTLASGESDWFSITAPAVGRLTVGLAVQSSLPVGAEGQLRLELWDQSGSVLITGASAVVGLEGKISASLELPIVSGQQFLIRVGSEQSSGGKTLPTLSYELTTKALTEDFGERVEVSTLGFLAPGQLAIYRVQTPAAGALSAVVASEIAGATVTLIDADRQTPLLSIPAAGTGFVASAGPVTEGQSVLVLVRNGGVTPLGYLLRLQNLDGSTTPGNRLTTLNVGPAIPVVGDFNEDGVDDLVASFTIGNEVAEFTSNKDGTFQAARRFQVGSALNAFAFARDGETADLNGDQLADLVVFNSASSDLSILLGNGDGTFQTQRRFDALPQPAEIEFGLVNDDDILDILVPNLRPGVAGSVSILIGRGDGTFLPQQTIRTGIEGGAHQLYFEDFNNDEKRDLLLIPENTTTGEIRPGLGNGEFGAPQPVRLPSIGNLGRPVDLDGDRHLDLLFGDFTGNSLFTLRGNGDFTFQAPQRTALAGTPLIPAAADVVSIQVLPDGTLTLGPADGKLDIVVPLVNTGGESGAAILAGVFATVQGQYVAFAPPIPIPVPPSNTEVRFGDFDGDKQTDIVFGGLSGLTVLLGAASETMTPNLTRNTARNLGVVQHHVEGTRSITSTNPDAWFRFTVPTEDVSAAGDQVLDIAGFFHGEDATGLQLEVLNDAQEVLGSGDRVRVRAAQGEQLFVHVSAATASNETVTVRGTGAYSLTINVLPQLVSAQADSLLPGTGGAPGGPVGSLVLTLQGDRLDPRTATNPAAYRVTWLGPDGESNTADDRVLSLTGSDVTAPVVQNPTANVNASSGQTFAVDIRQTITLTFADPLPPGSYQVDLLPTLQTAPFNLVEATRLALDPRFPGHPIVSVVSGQIVDGVSREFRDLVRPAGQVGNLQTFESGTPFLTQLHNDLSVFLDRQLADVLTATDITPQLLTVIKERLAVAIGDAEDRDISLLVLFLDPVSLDLVDPGNNRVTYNLQSNSVARSIPNAFVEVGGNVEVVVVPNAGGQFRLNVANVPDQARGGIVFLGKTGDVVRPFTSELRQGERSFTFNLEVPASSFPNQANAIPANRTDRASEAALAQLAASSARTTSASGGQALAIDAQAAARRLISQDQGEDTLPDRRRAATPAPLVTRLRRLLKTASEELAPENAAATEKLLQDLLDQVLRLLNVSTATSKSEATDDRSNENSTPRTNPPTAPQETEAKPSPNAEKNPPAAEPKKNQLPKSMSRRREDQFPWLRPHDRWGQAKPLPARDEGHRAIWMAQDERDIERNAAFDSDLKSPESRAKSDRDIAGEESVPEKDLDMPFSISDLIASVFRGDGG